MNASTPDDPADETRADDVTRAEDVTRADDVARAEDVASVVGEVSRSAEQESLSRPVTDVARSAMARVRRGGAAVGQRGTSLARRTPGTGLARRGAETGKRL